MRTIEKLRHLFRSSTPQQRPTVFVASVLKTILERCELAASYGETKVEVKVDHAMRSVAPDLLRALRDEGLDVLDCHAECDLVALVISGWGGTT